MFFIQYILAVAILINADHYKQLEPASQEEMKTWSLRTNYRVYKMEDDKLVFFENTKNLSDVTFSGKRIGEKKRVYVHITAKNAEGNIDAWVDKRGVRTKQSSRNTDEERSISQVIPLGLEGKVNRTIDPKRWRPYNDELAELYNKALSQKKISDMAIYNTFRYFEDNLDQVKTVEACGKAGFKTEREYEVTTVYKSKEVVERDKDGFAIIARMCWDIKYSFRDDYIAIADMYNIKSNKERLMLINLGNGEIEMMKVSHGKGSGGAADYAHEFSNEPDSYQSSPGFYAGYTTYYGGNGFSLRLLGLSDTNSEAHYRYIVIHAASYAASGGRSHGCPAVEKSNLSTLVGALGDGRHIADLVKLQPKDYISESGLFYIYDGEEVYQPQNISSL